MRGMTVMIDVMGHEILSSNISTLKEMSKDDSQEVTEYMTESEIKAINFDKVKRMYVNLLGISEECAKSVDTFAVFGDSYVLIEFKNGDMKNEKSKVKTKILHSLLILCDILKCDITATRNEFDFILVYNEQKNRDHNHTRSSASEISSHICGLAKEELVRFDLEKFKKLYFRNVHTYTEKEFDDYLSGIVAHKAIL